MKKLFVLLTACCLALCSCHSESKADKNQPVEMQNDSIAAKQQQHQIDRDDWLNWDNLTDERKAELLDKSKAAYDRTKAAKEEKERRKAQFEEAMDNWDNLSLDERRAAFDLIDPSVKNPTALKPANGECKHECGGACKHDCKHEGDHQCCKNK